MSQAIVPPKPNPTKSVFSSFESARREVISKLRQGTYAKGIYIPDDYLTIEEVIWEEKPYWKVKRMYYLLQRPKWEYHFVNPFTGTNIVPYDAEIFYTVDVNPATNRIHITEVYYPRKYTLEQIQAWTIRNWGCELCTMGVQDPQRLYQHWETFKRLQLELKSKSESFILSGVEKKMSVDPLAPAASYLEQVGQQLANFFAPPEGKTAANIGMVLGVDTVSLLVNGLLDAFATRGTSVMAKSITAIGALAASWGFSKYSYPEWAKRFAYMSWRELNSAVESLADVKHGWDLAGGLENTDVVRDVRAVVAGYGMSFEDGIKAGLSDAGKAMYEEIKSKLVGGTGASMGGNPIKMLSSFSKVEEGAREKAVGNFGATFAGGELPSSLMLRIPRP